MRVLLVEDNERLAGLVRTGLDKAGFAVDGGGTAAEGRDALAAATYDVLILDLGLPDEDGMVLLRELRARGSTMPVLILTARDGTGDRVKGLNEGADDYLLKPFAMEELVARVRALLRRSGRALEAVLTLGNLQFNSAFREARVSGRPLPLTRRELDALELLFRRAGRVVSKAALEEAIYPFDKEIASNAIEVLMHRLRKRLQTAEADVGIHTMRGIGYILAEKTP
ncbi:transcriptional regulatory protein QseB [mine drainage metagenome]|uniref:Transcriptional regulatory protein QseB n=1 Tax=mine drainage metagenome TaxID=410659 RepID=A0A1J5RW66_9ZZZZ